MSGWWTHSKLPGSPDDWGESHETWESAEDLPEACICGNGLAWWWDGTGRARCAWCDPPGMGLLKKVFLRKNTDRLPVEDVVELGKGLKKVMEAGVTPPK